MEKEKQTEALRTIPYPQSVHPIYETYPCKKKEGIENYFSEQCKQIFISVPEVQTRAQKKEDKAKEKEVPRPLSKKRFEELESRKICSLQYSRNWTQGEIEKRHSNELPKWFSRRQEPGRRIICPRKPDDYEQKLWIPICEKKEEEKETCKEPVDGDICVFCLGSLYLGGYIHDLFEKVPKVKKQSEKYGDEIAERIGIRTRITVHKRCYEDYVDLINHKKDAEEEEKEKDEEEEEKKTCEVNGKEEEKEEDEDEGGKDQDRKKEKGGKPPKAADLSKLPKKQCFCLKRFRLPKIASGECPLGC